MYYKYDGSAIAVSGAVDGLSLWASGPGQILQGGDFNDALGGQSNGTLIGGLGDNQYYLSGTDIVIVQGPTGVNTVTTWMNYALPNNIQNLNVSGDGLYAAGNSLDNLITVGDSNGLQLYGAGGNNVLVGGAGSDIFIVDATAGSNAIYGWHSGDMLRFVGGTFTNLAQVQAAMTQQGADVVLKNGLNDVVIRNTTISQFQTSDFYFGLDRTKLGAATFDDEFNSLRLHTASSPNGTWTPKYWYGDIGAYTLSSNGELQIYTAPGFTGTGTTDLGLNPFSISGGVLDIHAQTVTTAQSAAMWNYNYSSGVITTHDSFAQTYGYFEMRAELPTGVAGAWPAFWLVPADGSWPPELDVMETLSGSANVNHTTVHSGATGGHTQVGAANLVTDVAGYHTYGVLWTATDLTWYLDGQAVFHAATPSDMNKPMYMIANLAVGGWAGTPNFTSTDMKIDYIRAYALADGSSRWTSTAPIDTPDPNLAGGGTTTPPPASPTGLALDSIVGGYVNAARDVAGQTLSGRAAAGVTVTVQDGQTTLGTAVADTAGAWSLKLGVLVDGAHSLTATASSGGAASAASTPLSFVVDTRTAAPTGFADSAVVNGYVCKASNGPGQTLTGLAEAGSTVAISDQGVLLGSATADAAGHWSFLLGALAEGAHAMTATARDVAGNLGPTSTAFNFVVDTVAPIPLVSNVVASHGYTVISGRAEAGATVAVTDGTKSVGAAVADASGQWSLTASLNGAGIHSLTETALDVAGNTGASTGVTLYSAKTGQTLVGGTGADVLISATGDTLTGRGGADHFVLNGAFGKVTVTDFAPATATAGDQLWIDHTYIADFAHFMALAQQVGADVVVTVDKSDVLTLQNVNLSALHSGDTFFF